MPLPEKIQAHIDNWCKRCIPENIPSDFDKNLSGSQKEKVTCPISHDFIKVPVTLNGILYDLYSLYDPISKNLKIAKDPTHRTPITLDNIEIPNQLLLNDIADIYVPLKNQKANKDKAIHSGLASTQSRTTFFEANHNGLKQEPQPNPILVEYTKPQLIKGITQYDHQINLTILAPFCSAQVDQLMHGLIHGELFPPTTAMYQRNSLNIMVNQQSIKLKIDPNRSPSQEKTDITLLVLDTPNADTFGTKTWHQTLNELKQQPKFANSLICLVINNDSPKSERSLPNEAIEDFTSLNGMSCIFVNLNTGKNITECFEKACELVIAQKKPPVKEVKDSNCLVM